MRLFRHDAGSLPNSPSIARDLGKRDSSLVAPLITAAAVRGNCKTFRLNQRVTLGWVDTTTNSDWPT